MPTDVSLSVAPAPVSIEVPKEREYTPAIVKCWQRIGYGAFSKPVESYPWGGRSHHAAWRIVVSRYVEPADVLRAVWVRERAMREAPGDWMSREAGMCFIGDLLRERSDGRWQEEISEIAARLPTTIDYMDNEWGAATRALVANVRRDLMHVARPEDDSVGLDRKSVV